MKFRFRKIILLTFILVTLAAPITQKIIFSKLYDTIVANSSVSFGFNISFTGTNTKPASFTIN